MLKGIKNSKLSPAATEEQILEGIKKGRVARDALEALNVKLAGKLTRRVTQAGKRIKELEDHMRAVKVRVDRIKYWMTGKK